ncbi:hypothetical protein [Brumicola pallidula]|uniref:Uncharacterized protein n=1 Tax=Brumicola pallidula DSM 14239 = ACAM 615 TaxID=1121922 RepID=K6ZG33_9ALTE|nr:hypothetical protein [Glaciecola pallidula]GAC27893.1 hypothetical protein GPAL_1014 [Glaciecola pallidula DSM 14239 = ACAM 615]
MKFSRLDEIINTSEDIELSFKDAAWKTTTNNIKNDVGWLSEDEYHAVFDTVPQQTVYAFETFERVSKATGLSTRLSTSFVLGWESFNKFQQSTDILFLYVVSEQLDWVFYGNRDIWSFSTRYIIG